MANTPYDDTLKNLARAMEELLNNLSLDESARFVGCTIITGLGDESRIIHLDTEGNEDINYEIIEGPDSIYITAEIPPGTRNEPYADIQSKMIRVFIDDDEVVIDLPVPIHVGQSSYEVRNGIMDIVCKKLS